MPGQTCPTVNPQCGLTPYAFSTSGFEGALLATGDCGTPAFYATNPPGDFQGARIVLCNDTAALHAALVQAATEWRPHATPAPCDACVPLAAPGSVYVIWSGDDYTGPANAPPVCGSSCSLPWGHNT